MPVIHVHIHDHSLGVRDNETEHDPKNGQFVSGGGSGSGGRSSETSSFKAGETVTYAQGKGKTGRAKIERASTAKKGHYYIKTENEGTLLVPESELKRG